MAEHIRRAHPEHYISKLPATEESFQLMINIPPSESLPPKQQLPIDPKATDPSLSGSHGLSSATEKGSDKGNDIVNEVVPYLKMPEHFVQASQDFSVSLDEDAKERRIQAYAKLAAKDWTFYINVLKINIGRKGSNYASDTEWIDIDLGPNKRISRLHAQISWEHESQQWKIIALGRNSIWLNTLLVPKGNTRTLVNGDVIQVAGIEMMFVLPEVDPPRIHPEYLQRASRLEEHSIQPFAVLETLAPGSPATLLQPQQEDQDWDWDLKSIASLNTFRDSAIGSSLPSDISTSVVEGLPRTAQEEVLIILNSDSSLRSLFEVAARRMDKQRFVRNVRRLFLLFHKDLQDNVVDPREKDAAGIIEKHAQWLSNRLFDVCDPENGSNSQAMAAHLNQQVDKRPLLEMYLASMKSQSKASDVTPVQTQDAAKSSQENHGKRSPVDTPHPEIEGDSSSDSADDEETQNGDDNIDYSKFPNLEHIRNFIIGGPAFENLRRNTSKFVHPEDIPHSSRTGPNNEGPALELNSELNSSTPNPLDHSLHVSGNIVSQKSMPSTVTTDVTSPDADTDSDGDLSELSSDSDLYDTAPEDRIINPKSYFEKLRTTEREIFEDSGISAYKTGISTGFADDDFFLIGSLEPAALQTAIVTWQALALIKRTGSGKLLRLLECYNLAVRMTRSLSKLQQTGYCTTQISLLIQDPDRPDVAKLVQVAIKEILDLDAAFEGLLDAVVSTVSGNLIGSANEDIIDSIVERQDSRMGVTMTCLQLLTSMCLSAHLLLNDEQPVIWECTVQSLELAILSYAGAHIQRFDVDLLEKDVECFPIPRRFIYNDPTLREISARSIHESISIRRRRLQCLDNFLGEAEPWVFHQDFASRGNERLCLSTTIDALTDLWGPSWKIVRDSEPGQIQQFDIGNGAIIPWPADSERRQTVLHSEIFCHWISFKDWNTNEIETSKSSLERKCFFDDDILLIGAANDFGLVLNPDCLPSIERLFTIKTSLDQQGALRAPNTFRAQRYIDAHEVQVQGSALGLLSASGTVIYKRRKGQTMKDALVERWRHNLRNPMDLEAFSGIEISLCTRNARRRRLLHLLGSPTMFKYLRGITFVWTSEACEYAYFKALRSPKLFRKFWKGHPEYRDNVGDAISRCLDALEETGINEDSRELRGLWVESFDDTEGDSDGESDNESDDDQKSNPTTQSTAVTKAPTNFFEEWIVTLFRSEHTWTGFLEDSEESLTMAVLSMACLDFDHGGYGRRCSKPQLQSTNHAIKPKGYPVLQTSLQLNSSLLSSTKITPETVDSGRTTIWNAKELKKGTPFSLGDHGSLKVLTAASRTCPAIMEWSGVKSEIVTEIKNVAINEKILGRNKERHHREYIRGKWEAKPLPVLILSKSTKVVFSKS
jgi:hypothetical protein